MTSTTHAEYIMRERRRSNTIVRQIAGLLAHATQEAKDDESPVMGWLEHNELIGAWMGGLKHWLNHDGGPWLQEVWIDYLRALKVAGYEGGQIDDAIEEYDII
jgi:hypothetical protein